MIRIALAAMLAAVAAIVPLAARAQTDQQTLVDRATLTVQELLTKQNTPDARTLLHRAKGAMICPRIFKAGFIVGGSGGGCVLVGRGADGKWTSPAFYGIGSGSVGLQIGIQDAEVMFIVLTDNGLRALLDSQFKFGADASVAVATIGAGISGATTAALRADIVAFSQARGLFAGVSLDGSIISARSQWNQLYYGQPLAGQQIVLQGQGQNPGAEPLKEMLARFATP
ncbi:MAG: lipid-binding SYLF domain-containing protein [Rhodospirillales bacterium]|nr:lipid-binding SYLF domain-containing protein [Rhodospirillales bacterium]MDE2197978.1 lipid-binding SYLF domain-containing protein [Rhodospirillales bacterium]MDE2576469.1 lipid-binding SYLF domain-containing protein [Rhodospirillales bacterium]